MISPRCFEEAWIREQAAALRARDLRTLEKNILALELVSRLRREGLEFIFKGGTSLALFFDPVRRLSIDVAELAAIAGKLSDAVQTYRAVHAEQLRWGRGKCTIDQALDDTQDAAFWVCRRDLRPRETHEKIDFFGDGIRALDSHLFNQLFQIAESRLAAARAALVAEWIRQEKSGFDLPAFFAAGIDLDSLRDASLEGTWTNLNLLKQTDPKAFECWHAAQGMKTR